mmetsp:Transcript_39342/g.88002  ORF Transcript_39342/g.88002 Transcript_39342/m.88002 type:complete len:103 (-) Transcript_39342:100-408(-)
MRWPRRTLPPGFQQKRFASASRRRFGKSFSGLHRSSVVTPFQILGSASARHQREVQDLMRLKQPRLPSPARASVLGGEVAGATESTCAHFPVKGTGEKAVAP